MTARPALILFAHGARDPRWAQPFEAIAQAIRERRSEVPVHLAYLEFMSPSLIEAAESALAHGADHIAVVPLFLGAGGHVRKDLPNLLDELRARHPRASFSLEPAIGEREAVILAMADEVVRHLPNSRPGADKRTDAGPTA